MFVWLHTNSPPQHIANVHEFEFADQGGVKSYLINTNARRGINAAFCGVFENATGETSVHLFDTCERADMWMHRNTDIDLLIEYHQ